MKDTEWERIGARARNLRWIESMWDGTSTTAQEEGKKEELLSLVRDLANDSKNERQVREYIPWQPLW